MLLRIDMDLSTVDTDGIFDGLTGVGPWDSSDWKMSTQVNGGAPDGLAHQLNLTSGDNLSGLTITVTGTDADDNAQTEDITGPNNNTVESTKYYKTVTDVAASATLGSNTLDIGYVDEAVSPSIPLNYERDVPSNFSLDVTGTIDVDVQFTMCDISDRLNYADQEAYQWLEPSTSLAAETADSAAAIQIASGYTAARVQVNSYSTGAELQLFVSQGVE